MMQTFRQAVLDGLHLLRRAPPERLRALRQAALEARDEISAGPARRGPSYRSRVQGLTLLSLEPLHLRMIVQGSQIRPYEVEVECELDRERGVVVDAVCTCPYSGGSSPCKHTWAALDRLGDGLQTLEQARPSEELEPAPEAWRAGLSELDAFLEGQRQLAATTSSAVIEWRVGLPGGVPLVVPYERRRTKKGELSQGRKISLERLIRDHRAGNPEASAVLENVRAYQVGYYARQEYVLDSRGAMLALAGSPNVVWLQRPEASVEVVRGELEFRVRPHAEGGVEVVPFFGGEPFDHTPREPWNESVVILCDYEGNRLRAGPLDPLALKLVRRLNALGRRFPEESQGELFARLELLDAHAPVRLADELHGPPQPADARLRLLLTPHETGLGVQARVRPSGAEPALEPGAPAVLATWSEGRRCELTRDLEDERGRARAHLGRLGLYVSEEDADARWEWSLEDEDALDFLSELRAEEDLVLEWPQGQERSVRGAGVSELRVAVEDRPDWFGLEGGVEIDGETIPFSALLQQLRGEGRYLALDSRRWLKLSRELRERLLALRDVVHESRGALQLDASAAPVVERVLEDLEHVTVEAGWSEVRARLAKAQRVRVAPPRALRAELRPYQAEGFAWLKRLSTWGVGACLADDMGLGKTVQAIALLLARKQTGPALVVAPTSVCDNWQRELERFAPSLRAIVYRDADRADALAQLGPKDVVLTSYGLARIDVEELREVEWGTLVFDEAQQVKNAASKTAKALRTLRGGWRLALTGTPLENHLGELWALFRLISPGVLGSWESFKRRFAKPIERDGDAERRAALARLISPFVLRRTKDQVLSELPPRTDVELRVTLGAAERRLYEDTRAAAVLELTTKPEDRDARFQVLAALTRLRQLACHPRLVDASWKRSASKLEALLELVAELRDGGHRALVFSQFTSHLALVQEALDAEGVSTLYLDGGTPGRARQALVDRFQAGEGELFLISLKAGGKGLNLTGADYVVHLDPWWNPAVEDQATDRAHRMGQQKPVTVYRLVTEGTIEEQILALHADKRDLVAGVLAGANQAGKLSTEELLDLIRGEARPRLAPPSQPAPRQRGQSGQAGRAPAAAAEPPRAGLRVLEGRGVARAGGAKRRGKTTASERRAGAGRRSAASSTRDAERVRALRARHELSQAELGLLLGVRAPSVSRWEHGHAPLPAPRRELLETLEGLSARALRARLKRATSE